MTANSFKVGDRVVLARPDILDRMNGLKKGVPGACGELLFVIDEEG